MRDVSRVEYDAALERVIGSLCDKRACNHFPCTCDKATLAALGLDEPPTEEEDVNMSTTGPLFAFAICRCCHLHDDQTHRANEIVTCPTCGEACSCPGCVAESPSEPPKACPTCGDCPPSGICNGRCMQ